MLRWIKGLLAGGLLGFLGGIFLAPKKGDETRSKVKETVDKAKGLGQEMVDRSSKFVSEVKQSWEDKEE